MRGQVSTSIRAACVLLAGCGRVAFDRSADAGGNDALADDTSSTVDAPMFCTTNLVAHWPLDDTLGNTIDNVIGAFDGTWSDSSNNSVVGDTTVGMRGGALQFGVGTYITVPGFVIPSEGTFSAWLRSSFDDSLPPAGGSHLMVIDAPTPRTTISFADTGIYTLRTNDVSWQAQQTPPGDLTTWFHLAATWSATGAFIYIDGTTSIAPLGDARSVSPAPLFIGTRETLDRWWNGAIDDVRIYDRAMSPAEITMLMACP